MPWSTPSLATVRQTNRDYISGKLRKPLIPNDYPRVLADANAGNAHLNLQYLDWLALQLLPDTAEKQFLDKWANIFLVNADGTRGRKAATYATGTIAIGASVPGTTLPAGSYVTAQSGSTVLTFQTTADTVVAATATPAPVRCLTAGSIGNLDPGSPLSLSVAVAGIVSSSPLVVVITGGADAESDDELRVRLLARIQQPPMGGDADDYVNWALSVAGVTRAWCAPNEMGVGTVTVRIMCDDLRATTDPLMNGFPLQADLDAVSAFLDMVRPVTVKELYVEAPIPYPISLAISNLVPNTPASQAALAGSLSAMLRRRARPAYAVNGVLQPAQTISAATASAAISAAVGVVDFDLSMVDQVMPNNGCMAVLGPNSIIIG